MNYRFHIVDVFSSTPFGGNQLPVLPDAAAISTRACRRLLANSISAKPPSSC
jgi:predicted PhzF superfamily epimerase YddE/YHI9